MRLRSFIQLKETYAETISGLDPNDVNERNSLLDKFKNSIIVEGGCSELENLEKWTNENINEVPINQVWYGKIAYDFGLAEYFFKEEENAEKFAAIVPKIYTTYPHSYPSGLVCKSEGYDKDVLFDSDDLTSIVFK